MSILDDTIKQEDLESLLVNLARYVEFFGTPENWVTSSSGFSAQYDPEPAPIYTKGKRLTKEFLENPVIQKILKDIER